MPGKGDYGDVSATGQGQYFPGSKEWRSWDEGAQYRFSGTAITRPKTDNPHDPGTAKFTAWGWGWEWANTAAAGERRMPALVGAAPS